MGVPVQTRTAGDVEQPEPTLRQKALGGASAAVDAALSGYSAASSQELSTGEQLLGLGSAVLSGAAVGGPIGAVVAGLAYVFGVGKGNSRRRREEKRAANIEVLTREVGAVALPHLYGYCRVRPLPIYFGAGNVIGQSSTAYQGGLGGLFTTSLGSPAAKTITGGDEAFALQQFDLAAGSVSRVVDVLFRGRSIRDAAADNLFRLRSFMRTYPAGAAGDFAALFVPVGDPASVRRGAQTTFLGKSHLDALFWQWYGDPGSGFFDDQVELDAAFLFGDKIAPPTRTGTGASAVHGVGAAAESRNTFAVAFDYLTAPAKGPRNVPRSAIHLPSLYECWERAEVLLGGGAAGTAGVALDAAALRAQCREVVVANGAVDQSSTARTLRDCVQALGRGTGGNANTGISANSRVLLREGNAYRKRRHTFDGEVPSDAPPSAGLSLILETAPGAIAFPDNDGLLRFDVPDPSVLPGDADYAQGEINDDHLLAHPVVRHPSSTESANSIVVTHPDVNADFAENQQVVPAPGSALANQLRALDGEEIPTAITLEGVIDPELARSAGLNYLLQRRRPRGTCVTTLSPFRLLEGCRVRLRSEAAKLDMVVRILGKQIVDAAIVWSFIEYRAVDYAYHPAAIDPFDGLAPSADSVPPPTSVSAAYDASIGRVRVSWTPSADKLRVAEYHLARAVVAVGAEPSAGDWTGLTVVDGDETAYLDAAVAGDHDYRYRVRSGGRRGGFSDWIAAPAVSLPHPDHVIYGPLPAGKDCPPAGRGVPGSLWVTPDGRVFRKRGDVWTLAIPSDVGLEGVDGIVFAAKLAVVKPGDTFGTLTLPAGQYILDGGDTRLSDNIVDTANTVFQAISSRSSGQWRTDRLFVRFGPGRNDFASALEQDIGLAMRDKDGNTLVLEKTTYDPTDPYNWFGSDAAKAASFFAFLGRAGVDDVDFLFYRPSLRCSDPLNPWTADESLGVDGVSYREAAAYRTAAATPAQAAPAFTWVGAEGDPFHGLAVATPWVLTRPGAPAGGDVVWCSAATLSSSDADKTVQGHAPVVCERPGQTAGDLKVIFRRASAKPGKPSPSAGVPAGWSDGIPSGTLRLHQSIGHKPPGGTLYNWGDALAVGKGDDGDPGEDAITVSLAARVFVLRRASGQTAWTKPADSSQLFAWSRGGTELARATVSLGAVNDATPSVAVAVTGKSPGVSATGAGNAVGDNGSILLSYGGVSAAAVVDFVADGDPGPEGDPGPRGDPGAAFLEYTVYRSVTAGGVAPANPTVAYTYANGVFSPTPPTNWVEDHPGASRTMDVYCAVATLSSTATSATAGHVARCDSAKDVNLVYQRVAAQPATPAQNKRVPDGWSDNPPTGALQLWASFGTLADGAWSWKTPYKDGKGADGTTAVVVVQPPTVSTLGLTGNKATRTITITAQTGAASYTVSWLIVLPNGARDSGSANVASAGAHVFGTSPLPSLSAGSTVLIAVYANGAAGTLASATLEWTL